MAFLSVACVAPQVSAQQFDLYIGNGGRYEGDRYERRYRGGCSPEAALDTAASYGMRRVRIASMDRGRIVVVGVGRRGERTQMILRNDRDCSRLR